MDCTGCKNQHMNDGCQCCSCRDDEIEQLQAEKERLKEACQACVNIIGIKDITTAKKLCEQALKGM